MGCQRPGASAGRKHSLGRDLAAAAKTGFPSRRNTRTGPQEGLPSRPRPPHGRDKNSLPAPPVAVHFALALVCSDGPALRRPRSHAKNLARRGAGALEHPVPSDPASNGEVSGDHPDGNFARPLGRRLVRRLARLGKAAGQWRGAAEAADDAQHPLGTVPEAPERVGNRQVEART